VGASFSNHTGIATYKTLVSIDIAPATIGRFNPVNVSVLADAALGLAALDAAVGLEFKAQDQRADVADRQSLWRGEKARRALDDRGQGLPAAAVFDVLSRLAPADAVFTVDVGNHAYSFGRYLESKGQPVLMSGYLGSIGFGYPAAMGAWTADPSRPVIAVTGDGGFGQYLAELNTAVKYGMAIKHVLLDNASLGKIGKEQRAGQVPEFHVSLTNPNFADYAVLCGAQGVTVRTREELEAGMARMLAATGPFLLHIVQDAELV
jgi:thiamine pyrophosphate-dependent acetolactate synthase large subunit-like protein